MRNPIPADRPGAMAPDGSPAENPIEQYLQTGYHEIAGWLLPAAVEATRFLAALQATAFPAGPVCEIGVWEGRYLSLLSFLPSTPQRVVGIDPFIHGGDREAQLRRVRANLARYSRRPDLVTLIEKDSKQVLPDEILEATGDLCQFVSVDGDHTAEGALHDLRLVEHVLAPGGIVAVDDVGNMSCPGVIEAVVRYGMDPAAPLAPFLLVANKLFMTQKRHCEGYREAIVAAAASPDADAWGKAILDYRNHMRGLGVPVRLVGEELLVAP